MAKTRNTMFAFALALAGSAWASTVSVVETGGVPRFAIDGKPMAATAVMPSPAGKPGAAFRQLKAFRKAGIMVSSDVRSMHNKRYNPRQWWLGEGEYDFELFDALAMGLVDASPHVDFGLFDTDSGAVELAGAIVMPAPKRAFKRQLMKVLCGLNCDPWLVRGAMPAPEKFTLEHN